MAGCNKVTDHNLPGEAQGYRGKARGLSPSLWLYKGGDASGCAAGSRTRRTEALPDPDVYRRRQETELLRFLVNAPP